MLFETTTRFRAQWILCDICGGRKENKRIFPGFFPLFAIVCRPKSFGQMECRVERTIVLKASNDFYSFALNGTMRNEDDIEQCLHLQEWAFVFNWKYDFFKLNFLVDWPQRHRCDLSIVWLALSTNRVDNCECDDWKTAGNIRFFRRIPSIGPWQ